MGTEQAVSNSSTTKKHHIAIKKCSCKNEFQDKEYGVGVRVKNSCKDGKELRCTVCNSIEKV